MAVWWFSNAGVALVTLAIMLARVPDLNWEIGNGRRSGRADLRKPPFYKAASVILWAALPALWLSLYHLR
ncbi:hypothetical protein [Novosphingobium sp. PhB165]|uniref:hypothetical protein n=1 Tax=Novosphingobium sp. PhB165 TaxID=2485105 RepID=UPI00140447DA|nr:hypothetical protein [Novosphingobium sp. PhB165]